MTTWNSPVDPRRPDPRAGFTLRRLSAFATGLLQAWKRPRLASPSPRLWDDIQ